MLLPLAMVCVKGYEGERRKVPGVRSRRRGFEKQRFFSRRDKKALTSGLWHAREYCELREIESDARSNSVFDRRTNVISDVLTKNKQFLPHLKKKRARWP